jgi:SagB-type dehydrogenase family enzyme
MGNREISAILDYHEATKHSVQSLRASSHSLDWENKPLPFKIYRQLEAIPLIEDFPARNVPALTAIAAGTEPQAPNEGERIPDLTTLSRVLYLSAGITKRKRYAGGEVYFRAYPNTGALYHVDLYLVTRKLPELEAGVYHFGPHDFALRQLRKGDWREVLVAASGNNPDIARAPVVIVSASTYWRNSWKYQGRAWRHCFWDAGTLHANLIAVSSTEALEPRVVLGWADHPVERLLGLDPRREGVLTLVALGRDPRPPSPAPVLSELRLETERLSRTEVEYPEIRAAQAASSLADGAEAAAWRAASPPSEEPEASGPRFPPRPSTDEAHSDETLDRVIRRRGSTRAFDRLRPLSFDSLSTVLDRASRGIPADFLEPPGSALCDLYLIVNAIEGLAPGAYRYRRTDSSLELLRGGSFRRQAGRLALGQQIAADAAVNVYSLAHLPRVLERFGNRGYRAAQLEGAIIGGRVYLAAYAERFGASGLTFFDDEVSEFFSPHAAGTGVMFLVALGYPDRAALGLAPRA